VIENGMSSAINEDLVSVVIPCYNVAEYIEDCIRSVFQQKVNLQVICVDNNSTDQTVLILQKLKSEFPELVITEEKDRGANHARNKGLALALGKYIQFLDADDRLLEGKIIHQVGLLSENSILVAPYIRKGPSGELPIFPEKNIWKGLFITRLGITSSALFNTNDVKSIGGWNTKLSSSQEYDLMFRLMKAGKNVVIDDQIMTVVLDRPSGQISTSDPKGRWLNYLNLRKQIFNELQINHVGEFDTNRNFYYQSFFDTIHIAYPHCPEEAKGVYEEFIKGKYIVQISPATGKMFHALMRVGGFEFAEKIKSLLKK
jgi:glycosyltransferase involved in cell wall biosynthesis